MGGGAIDRWAIVLGGQLSGGLLS